jgi:septum formation protein
MAVILASTSVTRQLLMRDAGIVFTIEPPPVEENQIKSDNPNAAPAQMAMLLATAKAIAVSQMHLAEIIIGADQVLEFDGRIYDKPRTAEEAASHLRSLRGKTHRLLSAVCCAKGGASLWQHCGQATLTMRNFSDGFMDNYLARVGDAALTSVGAYKLEGQGLQLFSAVEGDHFTILGLPMLPLLEFLRSIGEIPT